MGLVSAGGSIANPGVAAGLVAGRALPTEPVRRLLTGYHKDKAGLARALQLLTDGKHGITTRTAGAALEAGTDDSQ